MIMRKKAHFAPNAGILMEEFKITNLSACRPRKNNWLHNKNNPIKKAFKKNKKILISIMQGTDHLAQYWDQILNI